MAGKRNERPEARNRHGISQSTFRSLVPAYFLPCNTCAISSNTKRRAGNRELTTATAIDITSVKTNSGSGKARLKGISVNRLNCSVRDTETHKPDALAPRSRAG